MRSLLWFFSAATVHFAICVAGSLMSLTAAFASQGRGAATALSNEPVAVLFALAAQVLLMPAQALSGLLPGLRVDGYAAIAATSVCFGLVAAAADFVVSGRRRTAARGGRPPG